MSEAAHGPVYAELATYGPTSLTVRVLQIVLNVLPGADPLPVYQTLDEAAGSVFGGVPPDVLERARALLLDKRVEQALFAARSIDTGDTGLTIVSGVRSAVALFFGSKQGRAEAVAQQQRTDAALKALGLAYLVTRLIPLPAADRFELVQSVPAGTELVTYYGAIEIALPFAANVLAANGTFVRDLVREQGRAMADKLLGVVGRQGVADAQETLAQLTEELDRAALLAAPHTAALAEQIRAVLPSYAVGAGDLFDLVAAGADALPCYRYLCARLATETALALAKHERMPEVELPVARLPQPAAPVPDAPPLPPELAALATGQHRLPRPAPGPSLELGQSLGAELAPDKPEPEPRRANPTLMVSPEDLEALLEEDEPETSAPAPVQRLEVAWPTVPLPEAQRLRGYFLAGDPPGQWRIFTIEGVYSEHPPLSPADADWEALRRQGHRVALYRREGESLTITEPGATSATHRCARSADQSTLTLDDQVFRRTDWDLSGRHLDGTWQAGEERLRLSADGTLERRSSGSTRQGRYTLGVAAITLSWSDGTTEVATLLSDLKPSSRRPAALWLADRWWSLTHD